MPAQRSLRKTYGSRQGTFKAGSSESRSINIYAQAEARKRQIEEQKQKEIQKRQEIATQQKQAAQARGIPRPITPRTLPSIQKPGEKPGATHVTQYGVTTTQVSQAQPREPPLMTLQPTLTPLETEQPETIVSPQRTSLFGGLFSSFKKEDIGCAPIPPQIGQAEIKKLTIIDAFREQILPSISKKITGQEPQKGVALNLLIDPERETRSLKKPIEAISSYATFSLGEKTEKIIYKQIAPKLGISGAKTEEYLTQRKETKEAVKRFITSGVKEELRAIKEEPEKEILTFGEGKVFTKVLMPTVEIVAAKSFLKIAPKVTSKIGEKILEKGQFARKAIEPTLATTFLGFTTAEVVMEESKLPKEQRGEAAGRIFAKAGREALVFGSGAFSRGGELGGLERTAARLSLRAQATGNVEIAKISKAGTKAERIVSGLQFKPSEVKPFRTSIFKQLTPKEQRDFGQLLAKKDVTITGSAGQEVFPVKFLEKGTIRIKEGGGLEGQKRQIPDIDLGVKSPSEFEVKATEVTHGKLSLDIKPQGKLRGDPFVRRRLNVDVDIRPDLRPSNIALEKPGGVNIIQPSEQVGRKLEGIFSLRPIAESELAPKIKGRPSLAEEFAQGKEGTYRIKKDLPDFIQLVRGLGKTGISKITGRRLSKAKRVELEENLKILESFKPEDLALQKAVGKDKGAARFLTEEVFIRTKRGGSLKKISPYRESSFIKKISEIPKIIKPKEPSSPKITPSSIFYNSKIPSNIRSIFDKSKPSPDSSKPSPSTPRSPPTSIPSPSSFLYNYTIPSPKIPSPSSFLYDYKIPPPSTPPPLPPLFISGLLFGGKLSKEERRTKDKKKYRPSLLGIERGQRATKGLRSGLLSGLEARGY